MVVLMTMAKAHSLNSKAFWEDRYAQSAEKLLYPKEPSAFLMKALKLLPNKSTIADLASGEGRNAVAMALKGHEVKCFDFIEKAISRTKDLAKESGVELQTKVQDLDFFLPDLMSYDAIVCIDFKPPATLVKNMIRGLKKNGLLIMEAYLISACQKLKGIEVFETFKSGELLRHFSSPALNFRCTHYSECGDFETPADKVQMIVQKTEML